MTVNATQNELDQMLEEAKKPKPSHDVIKAIHLLRDEGYFVGKWEPNW